MTETHQDDVSPPEENQLEDVNDSEVIEEVESGAQSEDFQDEAEDLDDFDDDDDDEVVGEESAELPEIDPDDPCTASLEEVESIRESVNQATMALAKSQLNARKRRRKVNRLEVELTEMELDLQEIQNAQQSLEEWVRARRGSFAWKLSDALAHERNKAQAERSRAEAAIIGGRERALRLLLTVDSKRKLWPRLGALLMGLTLVVIGFQYLRNLSPWPWTQYIPTPWPMIGFAALIFSGFALSSWLNYERAYASSVLLERWKQRKDEGVRGLDSGQHALALIDFTRGILVPIPLLIALGFGLMFIRDLLPSVALSYFPRTWVLWLILAGIYLGSFFAAWMNYYKFISRFRRQLREVLYESNRQKRAYLHANTEELRLGAMHSLVPDYLEMLGGPINSPWEVDLSQVRVSETRPDGSLLPASVGLAEATGGDSRQWQVMEMKSRSLLYRPGWITQAFRNILERIAEYEGLNPRQLTPDTLASDPGDSRRGQRRLVAEASSRPEILSSTGQVQLRTLSESIQRGVIREIKPLVEPLREDELDELDISTSRFKVDNPGQVPWDAFLKEALSDAAPFSMLTFSETGIARQSFMVHESHALVPGDLVDTQDTRRLRIINAEESAHSTPLDLVIRIDHSDWLDPNLLTLFSHVQLPDIEPDESAQDIDRPEADDQTPIYHPDE
jgi:Flp pilus assembly protein TadB